MAREGGLGKGLSSLIPQKKITTTPQKNNETKNKKNKVKYDDQDYSRMPKKERPNVSLNDLIKKVSLDKIKPNPFQPRKDFDDQKLEELAFSIKKHGVIQPLIVTQKKDGNYELIAGERRFKASQRIGLKEVPVIVRNITEKEKMEWAIIENIQRHDLNIIEEALAYQRLIEKFNYTQEEVAKQVGKSRPTIANILRLLELSDIIKQRLKLGELSEGHARALLQVQDLNKRESLASEIVRNQLSVRETEKRVKKISNPNLILNKNKKTNNFELQEFEDKISQALGTKVVIRKGEKGGKFILNYYSDEEFGNLFNKLTS